MCERVSESESVRVQKGRESVCLGGCVHECATKSESVRGEEKREYVRLCMSE